jgi:hypothetical protein
VDCAGVAAVMDDVDLVDDVEPATFGAEAATEAT